MLLETSCSKPVQSLISLMKSLGKDSVSLTVPTKLIAVIFFAEKMLGAFALKSSLHFSAKNARVLAYNAFKF